jgi:hypothetical protein
MTKDEVFVEVAAKGFKSNLERADKLFSRLSEDELHREIAPGKNRVVYLWGHLTSVNDLMIPLLGIGERLHPEFDELFLSNPDRKFELPATRPVMAAWDQANAKLLKGVEAFSTDDWLLKHGSVSEEDFAKDPLRNRFAILLSRTSHLAYHLGQVVPAVK